MTLGLEVTDMSAQARAARANGRKTISISCRASVPGQQHPRLRPLRRRRPGDRRRRRGDAAVAHRGDPPADHARAQERDPGARRSAWPRRTRRRSSTAFEDARHGWDASPVSVPRMIAELGEQIKNDDWAIVSGHQFTGDWQRRLLNHDKPYRYNGDCGGFGIGYDTPASVGGALAHKKAGRLSIGIVGDGDLNFGPGVLWTAAHHKIPLLLVVHNNRAYHAEVMIIQRMCGVRGRGIEHAHIGNVITDPNINYAQMAKAYGMYSEGPIENPKDLAGAYQRALAKVRAGEPALVDVDLAAAVSHDDRCTYVTLLALSRARRAAARSAAQAPAHALLRRPATPSAARSCSRQTLRCYACHGFDGQTGSPRLVPMVPQPGGVPRLRAEAGDAGHAVVRRRARARSRGRLRLHPLDSAGGAARRQHSAAQGHPRSANEGELAGAEVPVQGILEGLLSLSECDREVGRRVLRCREACEIVQHLPHSRALDQ